MIIRCKIQFVLAFFLVDANFENFQIYGSKHTNLTVANEVV